MGLAGTGATENLNNNNNGLVQEPLAKRPRFSNQPSPSPPMGGGRRRSTQKSKKSKKSKKTRKQRKGSCKR
jgi:hypothetical protein